MNEVRTVNQREFTQGQGFMASDVGLGTQCLCLEKALMLLVTLFRKLDTFALHNPEHIHEPTQPAMAQEHHGAKAKRRRTKSTRNNEQKETKRREVKR
jgi:hypothetical protein